MAIWPSGPVQSECAQRRKGSAPSVSSRAQASIFHMIINVKIALSDFIMITREMNREKGRDSGSI